MNAADRAVVREFLHFVTAQAKAAVEGSDNPGFLQLSRLHPDSEELVPSRFMLDDVEGMITTAVSDAGNGHNVYIEGRLVRPGLQGKERGKFADTAAVFALVVDSDNDKGMGWEPNVPVSLTVESSPGNYHYWFFLQQAVSAEVGKQLGERIRKAVGADYDSGNVVQPYRVAGTINYPNKKKRERGRTVAPTRLLEFNPEVLWTPEDIEQAFPLPEPKPTPPGADEDNIPADTMDVIRNGVEDGQRSGAFWNVMIVLKRHGLTIDRIVELFETYPDGIAKKYRGRLRDEIGRAYHKINLRPEPETAPGIVFDPWAQYIVPTFPFDILPPLIRDYVGARSETIGCDPSAAAMTALGTFSGALHHGIVLRPMRDSDWEVCARLWILLVGSVSARKTPLFKALIRALAHYEAHVRDVYHHKLRDYERVKEEGDHASKPQKPEAPPCYLAWNTTVDKLGELLALGDGAKGLLMLADEVAGWLASMERYSGSGKNYERACWLQAYDGGPYRWDRIGRGQIFIKNYSVSILAGIQPTRLAEIVGLTSDGLLQRFIPLMMQPAKFRQARPCTEEAYSRLVREMIFTKPARLIMTDDAFVLMENLHRHLFDLEQASEGLALGFPGFVGKLQGITGSLALILHVAHDLVRHGPGGVTAQVNEWTVDRVRRLALDFILPHAREFYCGTGTAAGEQIRRLASWILTSNKSRIVASDLATNIADCRGLELTEVNKRVSPLVAGGWLIPEDKTQYCRAWKVEPQVHVQMAERAQEEEKRKAALAQLLRSSQAPEDEEEEPPL